MPRPKFFSDGVTTVCCVMFLGFSMGLWLLVDSTFEKILYYVFLLLPNYICGEWLAGKLLSKTSRLSVSNSGFSIMRIIVGVVAVLSLFGLAFGITMLVKSLSS